MAKLFKYGDKVFAKMRGYPAWPARVEGIADLSPQNTKYHVLFYGTLQRGVCKSREIFPYAENKSKYMRKTKRKGFQEALAQIEGLAPVPRLVQKVAIEKLTNGSYVPKSDRKTVNSEVNNSDCVDKKYEETIKLTNIISKQPICDVTSLPAVNNDEIIDDTPKQTQTNRKGQSSVQKRKIRETSKSDNISKTQKVKKKCSEEGSLSDSNAETPVDMISLQDSQSEHSAKSKSTDVSLHSDSHDHPEKQMKGSHNGPEIVSRSGRIIKKKSFPDEIKDPTPKKKRNRHTNNNNLDHQFQHHERSPQGEETVQKIRSEDAIVPRKPYERKQTACKWLATENCMARLDALVRAQLGMTRANPEACIRFLDDMYDLDLRPLMLKKHPEVVETIKRLRKYVGNANAWNFSEEQRRTFEEQAFQIRQKAQCLFDKFKVMFSAPDSSTFLKLFADSVIDFQEQTRHWPLAKIYALVTEPKIRRTTKGQKVQAKNKDS